MIEVISRVRIARAAYNLAVKGRLPLTFAARSGKQAHARLESGEEVGLKLAGGERLRDGELVSASDGRIFEVIALHETLVEIRCDEPSRAAWLLGDSHAPMQLVNGALRTLPDPQLEERLKKIGAVLSRVEAPFDPDVGVHGHDHAHGHDHGHEHGHEHGHRHR